MNRLREIFLVLLLTGLAMPTAYTTDMLWSGIYPGLAEDWYRAVTPIDGDDWIAVGGTDDTSIGAVSRPRVTRIDPSGAVVWDRRVRVDNPAGDRSDVFRGVVPSVEGGWVTAGEIRMTDGFGDTDGWVAKWTPTGNIAWSKLIGSTGREYGFQIARSSTGGYFVYGSTIPGGNVVLKLDESGDIAWQKLIAGVSIGIDVSTIAGTADGGCIVLGLRIPYNLVVRFAANGDVKWKREIGYSYPDGLLRSVTAAPENTCVLIGERPHGYFKAPWLLKLAKNGHIEWNKKLLISEDGSAVTARGWDLVSTGSRLIATGFTTADNWFAMTDMGATAVLWAQGYRHSSGTAIATALAVGPGVTFMGVGLTPDDDSWVVKAQRFTGTVGDGCEMGVVQAVLADPTGATVEVDSPVVVSDASLFASANPAVVIEAMSYADGFLCSEANPNVFASGFDDGTFGDWDVVSP